MLSPYNTWLIVGAVLSGVAALLHVAIVFGGASWYRFFGAGERMASAAAAGRLYCLRTSLAERDLGSPLYLPVRQTKIQAPFSTLVQRFYPARAKEVQTQAWAGSSTPSRGSIGFTRACCSLRQGSEYAMHSNTLAAASDAYLRDGATSNRKLNLKWKQRPTLLFEPTGRTGSTRF